MHHNNEKPSTLRQCNIFVKSASVSLYAALLCKFIESFSYMLVALTLRSFLEENWAFGDISAGIIDGIWGIMTTVFGILFGPIIDKVGVRWSLLVGCVLLTVSRFHLAYTLSETMLLFNLYVILPAGQSLGIPVILISMRRYSVGAVGSITYGALFLAQSMGSFSAGIVTDVFREQYPRTFKQIDSSGHVVNNSTKPSLDRTVLLQMTAYRYVILVSAIATCVMFLIALLFVFDEEVVWVKRQNKTNKDEAAKNKEVGRERRDQDTIIRGCNISTKKDLSEILGDDDADSGARWEMQPYMQRPTGGTCEMLSSLNTKAFWIFLLLVATTIGVRMLYRHLDVTFPEYAEREMGKSVKYGLIVAANPLATVIFTLLFVVLCAKLSLIPGILLGTFITATSVLWLVGSSSVWAGYAFSIMLGLGEAIWIPRFYELSISKTAPEGQEGLFSALVYSPTFFVKLFTGVVSGNLLQAYVPEVGKHDSRTMWLIIFLMSITSPILIGILHYTCGAFDILLEKITSSNEKREIEEATRAIDQVEVEEKVGLLK